MTDNNSSKELLLYSLNTFYNNHNIYKLTLKTIIEGKHELSLRMIDWLVTRYAKTNNIIYWINETDQNIYNNLPEDHNNEKYRKITLYLDYRAQLKSIKKQINESREDTYNVGRCKVDVEYYGLTFNGNEIFDIVSSEIDFTFNIYLSFKSYGIKDISVYNPQGPSEIELTVIYYGNEDEDEREEVITLPLNWDDPKIEDAEIRWIGFDNEITISLKNNEEGGLMVDSMTLYKNEL